MVVKFIRVTKISDLETQVNAYLTDNNIGSSQIVRIEYFEVASVAMTVMIVYTTT